MCPNFARSFAVSIPAIFVLKRKAAREAEAAAQEAANPTNNDKDAEAGELHVS